MQSGSREHAYCQYNAPLYDSTYIRMSVIISVHHISPKPQILMRGTLPGQVTGSSEF